MIIYSTNFGYYYGVLVFGVGDLIVTFIVCLTLAQETAAMIMERGMAIRHSSCNFETNRCNMVPYLAASPYFGKQISLYFCYSNGINCCELSFWGVFHK